MSKSDNILKGVGNYYSEKIKQHGNTSLGVDWNSKESQYTRFEQLCKVVDPSAPFSLLDYGCGTGELVNYLSQSFTGFNYTGYDVSQEMINTGLAAHEANPNVAFTTKTPAAPTNYLIASGIFNVKLDLANNEDWLAYILETLRTMNTLSTKGFSFNALTKYSDKEYMKDYLYYADPLFLFDYCKQNFSRNIALLHDYNLYEFTVLVKK